MQVNPVSSERGENLELTLSELLKVDNFGRDCRRMGMEGIQCYLRSKVMAMAPVMQD